MQPTNVAKSYEMSHLAMRISTTFESAGSLLIRVLVEQRPWSHGNFKSVRGNAHRSAPKGEKVVMKKDNTEIPENAAPGQREKRARLAWNGVLENQRSVLCLTFGFWVRLFTLLCMWLASQTFAKGESGQDISFESFLTNPPTVRHAAFDVIYGNTTDLKEPHDLSRTFVLDGTNFLMSEVPIGEDSVHKKGLHFSGELNGVRWHGGGWGNVGLLMMFDPSLNTNSSDPNAPMYWDQTSPSEMETSREGINLLMHLGIEHMVPGSIIWQPGATNFSAGFSGVGNLMVVSRSPGAPPTTNFLKDDGTLLVQLHYDRDGLAAAKVKYADRSELWDYSLKYEYDNAFFNGHLPCGWTVYSKTDENEKILYKIKIRDLELTGDRLPPELLDPRKALAKQWEHIGITSNNVEYWLTKHGMAQVLTAQAAQAQDVRRSLNRDPFALGRARMLIVGAFLVPPLLFVLYWRNRKTKM